MIPQKLLAYALQYASNFLGHKLQNSPAFHRFVSNVQSKIHGGGKAAAGAPTGREKHEYDPGLIHKTQQFVKIYVEEVKNEIKSLLPGKKPRN